MKAVVNDILDMPEKFQVNRSNVTCEKTELPLLPCFYPILIIASVIGYFGWEYFGIGC